MTLEFDASATFTLAAGQVDAFTNEPGLKVNIPIFPSSATIAITIAGDLRVASTSSDAPPAHEIAAITSVFTGVFAQSRIDISATGSIHVDTSASGDSAVAYDGNGLPVTIEGLVDVRSGAGDATGLLVGSSSNGRLAGDPALVVNSGQIHVVSAGGGAAGIYAADGNFLNAGSIDVTGHLGATGVATSNTFDNTGSIVAHDASGGGHGEAVLFIIEAARISFLNAGLLQGDTALFVAENPPSGFNIPHAIIENTGQMIGAVVLPEGDQTLLNEGTITGAISLGDGGDVYDGRSGTETGLLQGGLGNDTELGGAGFDNLQGNQGDDSLSGGAGDDFVVGGKDNDIQFGDDGNDVVWGNLGNDTLDGGIGADQVRGGQGDDSVSGGAGDDFISGDRGNDTESGGAGADIFHGSQDAGIDRVLDFHLSEGDRVMLDPGTTFTVTQVGADTVIDMGPSSNGAPNQMILVGVQMSTLTPGWIFGA